MMRAWNGSESKLVKDTLDLTLDLQHVFWEHYGVNLNVLQWNFITDTTPAEQAYTLIYRVYIIPLQRQYSYLSRVIGLIRVRLFVVPQNDQAAVVTNQELKRGKYIFRLHEMKFQYTSMKVCSYFLT